jgi:hypothetical protein
MDQSHPTRSPEMTEVTGEKALPGTILYDFVATSERQVSVQEGDIINVINHYDEFSEIYVVWSGKKGFVPNECITFDNEIPKRLTTNLKNLRHSIRHPPKRISARNSSREEEAKYILWIKSNLVMW